jgi:enterobactin synthetase component D
VPPDLDRTDDAPLPVLERRVVTHGWLVTVQVPALRPADGAAQARLLAGLGPTERVAAARMGAPRLATWAAGRAALRQALTLAGAPAGAVGDLPADAQGAPIVPSRWLGSVSHKQEWAVALATRRPTGAHYVGVGVDVERRPDTVDDRVDLARRVLTAAELERLEGIDGVSRRRAVLLRFSLKEALYKAIAPLARRWIGFREVEAWPEDDGRATFTTVVPELAAAGVTLEGWWDASADRLLTSVRAVGR